MAQDEHYDVVCIGGGTAGMTAARAARTRGATVAIVEREPRLGGDCTFWGCVPSKSLIEVAKLAHQARKLSEVGFAEPQINLARVMDRKDRIVDGIANDERAELFEELGVSVIRGEAAFEDATHVRVDGRVLEAGSTVLACGTDPAVPPIPGLRETPHLTNRTVFDVRELPDRLIVLGGGAIGLELGQAFSRFGSRVTVVELMDTLLFREEPEAGETVADALRGEGIDLRLGTKAEKVELRGEETVVTVSRGDETEELAADALLVAIGRRANSDDLNLEAAGVETERGFVTVDERLRTSAPGVYAAGDIGGGFLFTHVASYEGRIAGVNATGARQKTDYRVVPWVTFTEPEVARVGMTESEAREKHGDAVDVATFPMRLVDRARILGEEDGFVKLVTLRKGRLAKRTGGRLLGAHVVGPKAGELLHEAVIAMQARAFTGRLAQAIHAYPSTSIALQQAAAQLFPEGRALTPVD
jgi:pyruvate/2-oxoglutarate dehydrogenase complex dihydrolipoamide dehydrogenase (E3) component